MPFLLFKYGLPILLGYILFLGISGRFLPFILPEQRAARPSWFFGLWAGVAVALVLGIALHLAYQLPPSEARALLKPSLLLLGALLLPGCIGYWLIRRSVTSESADTSASAQPLDTVELDRVFATELGDEDDTLTIGFIDDFNRIDNFINRNSELWSRDDGPLDSTIDLANELMTEATIEATIDAADTQTIRPAA